MLFSLDCDLPLASLNILLILEKTTFLKVSIRDSLVCDYRNQIVKIGIQWLAPSSRSTVQDLGVRFFPWAINLRSFVNHTAGPSEEDMWQYRYCQFNPSCLLQWDAPTNDGLGRLMLVLNQVIFQLPWKWERLEQEWARVPLLKASC